MICNEFDAGNAEQTEKETVKEIQMKFFLKGETNMQETNARAQRNNRELHLEMVSDKVTYVRVY